MLKPWAGLGKHISVWVIHVMKFLQKLLHFLLFTRGLCISHLPPWEIFISCFSFSYLIMQMPVHLCPFVSECFSSYSVGWRERALTRSHLGCVGSLLTDTPWCRRERCRRKILAICLWFRPRLGVILTCLLSFLWGPQKVSECSIIWMAFELASVHGAWKRKDRWQ